MANIIIGFMFLGLIMVMIWSGETVLKAGREHIATMKEVELIAKKATAEIRKQNEEWTQKQVR